MRLDGLDLNLLVALDVLLQEGSVTAASARLHLSQPSMSGALKRLRDHFGDELFTPMGRSLVPTAFALSLEKPVRETLQFIRTNLKPRGQFIPGESERHFTIAASDAAVSVLLSDFVLELQSVAPGVSFQFVPGTVASILELERGSIDFLIAPRLALSTKHPTVPLFWQSVSCIAWEGSDEVKDGLTLDVFKRCGHAVVRFGSDGSPSFEEFYFKQLGFQRRIEVAVYGFAQLPAFVVGTRRIATLQTYLAVHAARTLALKVLPPPLDIPRTEILLQWHSAFGSDPGANWLQERLIGFAARCKT